MTRLSLSSPFVFFVSLGVMIGVFVFKFQKLPPEIPLFYSRPGSNNQVADLFFIFIIPILILLFISVNNIALKLVGDNRLLKKIIYYTNLIIIVIFTTIFTKIILHIS